jgi:hypothetical protein
VPVLKEKERGLEVKEAISACAQGKRGSKGSKESDYSLTQRKTSTTISWEIMMKIQKDSSTVFLQNERIYCCPDV